MPNAAEPNLTYEPVETDADIDDLLQLRNSMDPQPISRTTLAARIADDAGSHRRIVRADGVPVAAAWLSWTLWMGATNEAAFRMWVQPAWRGRGIGSRLFDDQRSFAVANRVVKGTGRVLADDAYSLAFLQRRGFEPYGRQRVGLFDLDIARESGSRDLPDGIAIASIAERPDRVRQVYELERTTLREVPSVAEMPPPTWEDWSAHLSEPVYLRDLSLVALEGETVVGSIQVDDDGEGDAFIIMLSVAPAMRRRGIARALKVELARRAALGNWRHLVTQNDGSNDAVRGLNESLGYRYLPAVTLVQGSLEAG